MTLRLNLFFKALQVFRLLDVTLLDLDLRKEVGLLTHMRKQALEEGMDGPMLPSRGHSVMP